MHLQTRRVDPESLCLLSVVLQLPNASDQGRIVQKLWRAERREKCQRWEKYRRREKCRKREKCQRWEKYQRRETCQRRGACQEQVHWHRQCVISEKQEKSRPLDCSGEKSQETGRTSTWHVWFDNFHPSSQNDSRICRFSYKLADLKFFFLRSRTFFLGGGGTEGDNDDDEKNPLTFILGCLNGT